MSKSQKWSVALVVAVAAVLVAAFTIGGDDAPAGDPATALVRDDSPRLASGGQAVFVEFLDFECEACGASHAALKELRTKYGDRITFVVRHLPLHGNSMNASLAAEAAAQQGQFEAMHDKLFETQGQWGHRSDSQMATFTGYAEDLGLDMTRFRKDLEDPTLRQRIEQSRTDATTVGVTGTPTFFLDGEKIEPSTLADMEEAFDAALAD